MAEGKSLNLLGVAGVATVALAIIVLVGIAILTQFSRELRVNTGAVENLVTIAANQSLTQVGTVGEYDFIQTIPSCINVTTATLIITPDNYTVVEGAVAGSANGFILNDASVGIIGDSMNCTLTYLADSTPQASADLFIAGLAIFGTFMAVIILALIGKVIVGFFVSKK